VTNKIFWLPAVLAGASLTISAQPSKIAVINLQQAIISTKDGQKAAKDLEAKFMPKRQEIEKRQAEIAALQNQLRASSNTASEDAKNKLMRDIDAKQKSLQRDGEDASAELDQEQQKLFQEVGGKLMAVLDKFASDNGYALVIDVSAQSSPVLYASQAVEITRQVIDLYDKNAPAMAPAPPTAGAPASAKPTTSAPPTAKPKPAGGK